MNRSAKIQFKFIATLYLRHKLSALGPKDFYNDTAAVQGSLNRWQTNASLLVIKCVIYFYYFSSYLI